LTVSVFAVMHRRPVRPVRDDTVSRSDPSPVGACPAVLADRHRVVPGAITGTWLRRATAAGRLQHRLPLAGKGRGRCCCARTRRPLPRTWRPARWPARPAGRACCGPGGYGRERVIRLSGGERRRLRARRGRCRACSATHLLIPSWAVPRRADGAGVIARATARSVLHGTGTARLGAELGVPGATVRGWLRRLRGRAGQLLQEASSSFGRLVMVAVTREGRDPSPPGPTGSALGDALAAVAACAMAAIGWHGHPGHDFGMPASRCSC
jgi:hypothetical protein